MTRTPAITAADTIGELLMSAAGQFGASTWLRDRDGSQTFLGAAGIVAEGQESLRQLGIGPGDLVALRPRTTPPWLLLWLAVTSLGAIAVPLDPDLADPEFAGLLRQVSTSLLVVEAARLVHDRQSLAEHGVTLPVQSLDDVVGSWTRSSQARLPATSVGADTLAALLPTSGTTGRSKLVMQTHRTYAWAGVGFPFWLDLTSDDRMLTTMPFFHVNALAYSSLGSLSCGAQLCLEPRFSASRFLEVARDFGATQFNAIGAMLEFLMRQPVKPDDADNPLRICYSGPSPTQAWQEDFERRLGLQVVCGYGLSESTYGLIWRRGHRPFATLGSLRQHPDHAEVNTARVVDSYGDDVPIGDVGELLLRNPTVTPGYWQLPDETSEALRDGWLHTGDLVRTNSDATYTFVARKKEVLRRRGMNVAPQEIEDVLNSHPEVSESAVIAVPSEFSEDDIKAFVVTRSSLALADLHDWTQPRLTAFKVPRYWQRIEQLPRTATQRIAKHELTTERVPDEYDAEAAQPGDNT